MRFAPALLCAVLWTGVACTGPTQSTQARWVTTAGEPAVPEAVEAAAAVCEERVAGRFQTRQRYDSLAWGVAIVECMESEGFVRESSPQP